MWTVEPAGAGTTLAAFVKAHAHVPWTVAKRHVSTGKVFVDDARVTEIDHRLAVGQRVELRMSAPRPHDPEREGVLVYDDAHVVVIDKPSGISSVPYDAGETGTAMDLIRGAWRRMNKPATSVALHVVHRIDRATSGLLVFAKTKRAEIGLAAQLRAHTMERTYLCIAHGAVSAGRIESMLVPDRGDGLRGSTTHADQGKRAVTHVTVHGGGEAGARAVLAEATTACPALARLRGATACAVRLETGKTHQIRIHLAESGHPLVGEPVYIRDFEANGGRLLPAPRLLLHAATLGFAHPITGARVALAAALPPDFTSAVDALAR